MRLFGRKPSITLGSTRRFWFLGRKELTITPEQAQVHMHVLGKTGSGKSNFLANLFLKFFAAGMPVTLIDPHGDLSKLILKHLVARGVYDDPSAYDRIIYLDIPTAARRKRYLPFNFLDQPYGDHEMAELVMEAARRAWPELATGAPTFENILKHSVVALRQADLPLTRLADLLTDKPFRDRALRQGSDPQVVRFFRGRMEQWGREEATRKESTLSRADLLTLSPVLRYSLGHRTNRLSFREIIDSGRSMIISLARPLPEDTKRLFGCLLTVGMENAALSRADDEDAKRRVHHLLIDEFSQFMAQSETSLTRMLSETRKYGLFSVMAHQNWSQASDRLKGALQNVGIEMILKTGRMDAEYSARLIGAVNPMEVKHVVTDDQAEERTHPSYLSLPEQWERHVQAIQRLRVGETFVRLPDDSVHNILTPSVPKVVVPRERLEAVRQVYLTKYFGPIEDREVLAQAGESAGPAATIGRRPRRLGKTIFRR
ncbi:hypothetical protein GCM10023321_26190 [Pseudonocardia eucalypti]|uniref:Type IV secretion system coupling protein TraD DNA-binding domain-containing protein n=1 Tax=Pseudonocardia eucalypti TaxID=648755 RepID=A0ABP9Q3Z8_9PSEU|nr:hypothetical protein [Pseudonocardia eucalypti]